jgi:hypothetical protein
VNGGSILIDPPVLILNDGVLNANALSGNGGNLNLVDSALLETAGSTVVASGAISITTPPDTYIAASMISLPQPPMSIIDSLVPACAQMTGGNASSFVQIGNGGPPPEPGSWLPGLELSDVRARIPTAK